MSRTTSTRAAMRVSPLMVSALVLGAACSKEAPTSPSALPTASSLAALGGGVDCTRCVTEKGKILFTTDRDGNWEIYKVNADGSNKVRLTTNSATDRHPTWSPDYKKIAFVSNRDGNDEIYIMNATGNGVVRVTNNAADDQYPVFSPDGKKLAFVSKRNGSNDIYTMNLDGTGVNRLTITNSDDIEPTWSPDGTLIAYASNRSGQYEIWVASALSGSGMWNFTPDSAVQTAPHFSPDGQRIAYHEDNKGTHSIRWQTLYQPNDGTAWKKTVTAAGSGKYVGQPSWSPDGQVIAFTMETNEGMTFTMTSAFNQPISTWYEIPGLFTNLQPAWSR